MFEQQKIRCHEVFGETYPLRDAELRFIIDLVLIDTESDSVLAVLDTKYKRKEHPEGADIQQIVAYAVSRNTQKAILIYPSTATQLVKLNVGKINVCSLIFDP